MTSSGCIKTRRVNYYTSNNIRVGQVVMDKQSSGGIKYSLCYHSAVRILKSLKIWRPDSTGKQWKGVLNMYSYWRKCISFLCMQYKLDIFFPSLFFDILKPIYQQKERQLWAPKGVQCCNLQQNAFRRFYCPPCYWGKNVDDTWEVSQQSLEHEFTAT